jgi:hypothetical protein
MRVAPTYGADSGKMPKLFSWATSEEFLTGPGTRIPIRNLVQTPLQTAEAVAQYVQKHRRITPRPLHTSLTEYIANPLDNEYDDADWLHLGMDADWMRAGQASGVRYTLNLGVAVVGQAKGNTPRKNTKHFAELPLMDRSASMAFNFGVLDRKLPLVVASKLSRHAITRNQKGQSYALAAAGAPDAIGQAILVEFQLTNPGPADLSLKIVLADTVLRDIYGQVWLADDPKSKPWYAGYHRALGPYQKPPRHEDAALLLVEGKRQTLVAPNAGYNFGLVGVAQDVVVQSGAAFRLPLLFISLDRSEAGPDINLAVALETLREPLCARAR